MDPTIDIQQLIALRKLTTALSDYLSAQVAQHLANLSPLLNPRLLLGDVIRGEKFEAKGAEALYQEMAALYQTVAPVAPFQATLELKPPLDIFGLTPVLEPAQYTYTPEGGSKPITIRSPFKWVLAYKDVGPQRLRELIALHRRSGGPDMRAAMLHYLVLHAVTNKPKGFSAIMKALGFPVSHATTADLGLLPLTFVNAPVTSKRPIDSVIVMNTELSGTDSFDELVDLEHLRKLEDPLKTAILGIANEHAGDLMRSSDANS